MHGAADRIGLMLRLGNDADVKPIYISPRLVDQLQPLVVLETFSRVAQSQSAFTNYSDLYIEVDKVFIPRGGTMRCVDINQLTMDPEKILSSKRGNSIIKSDIYMRAGSKDCLAVSIALAIRHLNGVPRPSPERKLLHKLFSDAVTAEVENLVAMTGLDLNTLPGLASTPEFESYQAGLIDYASVAAKADALRNPGKVLKVKSYRLIIFDPRQNVLYEGAPTAQNEIATPIYLLLFKNHFYPITSLTGAFAVSYFCRWCLKGYRDRNQHKSCVYSCDLCNQSPPCEMLLGGRNEDKPCVDCNRVFFNDDCYNNHKRKRVCQRVRFCLDCKRLANKNHNCDTFFCRICLCEREYEHDCYMPSYTPKKKAKPIKYVFYDFECMMEIRDETSGEFHVPNLCISSTVCDKCTGVDTIENNCETCGERRHVFRLDQNREHSVVDDFLAYLFELQKAHQVIAIAHNGGSYDVHLILKRLFATQQSFRPFIVMRGSKIFLLKTAKLRFIDSLNFAMCALSKVPALIGLQDTLCKGFFPHKFNTFQNQNYIGPLPAKEFYEPDSMSVEANAEFLAWYPTVENDEFDFQKELIKYCDQDVMILRKFGVKLLYDILEDSGINIFLESCTLASYVSKRFRKDFYHNNIAVLPKSGSYRLRDNQSIAALRCLAFLEKYAFHTKVQSAYRGAEKVLKVGNQRIKVDGYVETYPTWGGTIVSKVCIEFQGCRWHGHECLTKGLSTTDKDIRADAVASLNRERTEKKKQLLVDNGYKVIEIWECMFNKFMNDHPAYKKEFDHITKEKLNPRDAFYGGSTDCAMVYYKCKPDEEMRYVDFRSLYPTVNKKDLMVLGVPQILVGTDCDGVELRHIHGLIKCRVLPPKNLLFPLLPVKLNHKLLFPLCFKCAETSSPDDCTHADGERGWVGTFVSLELHRALELGYKIEKVYEIWKYETTYGIFADFVMHFQAEKSYADGMPAGYDESNIQLFIDAYFIKEGVMLDKSKFNKNAARRNFAKSQLNSLWGKMGESNEGRGCTNILVEPAGLFKLVNNPNIEMKGMKIINENTLIVNFLDLAAEPLSTSSVTIAAFTTSAARLRLHALLHKAGKAARYFDTDSLIYLHKRGTAELFETGPYLGDLANELLPYGENAYITEYVSCGPKSYSIRIHAPDTGQYHTVCKIKGITLNTKNVKILNFESLREQILRAAEAPQLAVCDTFFVKEKDGTVRTTKRKKQFKAVITKRRRIGFRTFPFGYQGPI